MKNNERSLREKAFVFVAIISIILTIFIAIVHEIYINL
jgi:hypothetical protein